MPIEHEEGLISQPVPLLDEWAPPGGTTTAAPCGVDAARLAADGLATLLARAEGYLGELWPERGSYVARLGELRARLTEQRLQIAVLGQFKRGKSTF